MKIATFNINGVRARLPALLDWLAEARPDVVVAAGDQDRRRGLPPRRGRGRRLRRRDPRPEGLQRRRDPLAPAAVGRGARPARRRRRRAVPLDRGDRRRPADLRTVPAQRQSRRPARSTTTSSPGWSACAPAPRRWSPPRSRRAHRRLQRHPRGRRTAIDPRVWAEDALFLPPTRDAYRRLVNLGLTDAVRPSTPRPESTPSGTTRPAPGRRTAASASTTSC